MYGKDDLKNLEEIGILSLDEMRRARGIWIDKDWSGNKAVVPGDKYEKIALE